jgi:hypothetical protein
MAKTRFIPVTDAILLDRPEVAPRTFLANRTLVSCLAALKDD